MKNYVPQQFNIFRNGGEEFSIVLNDYTLDQCVKLGESIRAGVEQSTWIVLRLHVYFHLTLHIDPRYSRLRQLKILRHHYEKY